MDVLAEGARRVAAAAVAPSASPFVMDTPNVIGLLLSALVAFISGPGGQGGSSFYVCVFCVLLKLPLAEAAGTAAFVVFAGSVASALSAMGRLNPASAKPAPLIDYDSVLVMLPPMLLGIAWGVLVNAVLAEWCLNLLLLMTWAWMVYTLTRSLVRTVRLERRRKAAAAAAAEHAAAAGAVDAAGGRPAEAAGSSAEAAATPGDDAAAPHAPPAGDHRSSDTAKPEGGAFAAWAAGTLQALQEWWAVQSPASFALVILTFALLVAFSLAKAAVAPCSGAFWGLMGGQVASSAALVAAITAALLRRQRRRAELAASAALDAPGAAAGGADADAAPAVDAGTVLLLPETRAGAGARPTARGRAAAVERAAAAREARLVANEAAIQWGAPRLAAMPPLMLVVGVLAGMLGQGGGAFVFPMLVADGLHPQVVAATSKLVLTVSMCGTALSFLISGRLHVQIALAYAAVNVAVTPFGIWAMDKVVRRTGHPSLLTALSLVRFVASVALQAALVAVPAFVSLARDRPPLAGFHPEALCGAPARGA